MDYNDIRELAELMKETGLTSLAYRNGDESVKLMRGAETAPATGFPADTTHARMTGEPTVPAGMFTVKSPMVGLFYDAPGVDEKPFVEVGETVHTGDVLCVIEAMKIMNEITAECDGVIADIYVENKQVVEFGQPLFRISIS